MPFTLFLYRYFVIVCHGTGGGTTDLLLFPFITTVLDAVIVFPLVLEGVEEVLVDEFLEIVFALLMLAELLFASDGAVLALVVA